MTTYYSETIQKSKKKHQIELNPKKEQEESEINQAHQTYRRKR